MQSTPDPRLFTTKLSPTHPLRTLWRTHHPIPHVSFATPLVTQVRTIPTGFSSWADGETAAKPTGSEIVYKRVLA